MDYTNDFDRRIGLLDRGSDAPRSAITAAIHVYEALVTARAMLVSCGIDAPAASDLIALAKLQLEVAAKLDG